MKDYTNLVTVHGFDVREIEVGHIVVHPAYGEVYSVEDTGIEGDPSRYLYVCEDKKIISDKKLCGHIIADYNAQHKTLIAS
jgi:hypothetical protein